MIFTHTKYPDLKIGEHTYGDIIIHGYQPDVVTIGDYCSIADGVQFQCGSGHYMDFVTTYPFDSFLETKKQTESWKIKKQPVGIIVGNDVWIGLNVIIKNGVTVGDGAVIGMGAVVTKDVEPYSIVVGNPAKLLRYRFEMPIIDKLLRIKWWEWDPDTIQQRIGLMGNVNEFTAYYCY